MRKSSPDCGLTLIELLITSIVFAGVILGVGLAILSAWGAVGRLEHEHIVFAQAQSYADTLTSIRYGRDDDPQVGASELIELLDSNTFPGHMSLMSFTKSCPLEFDLDGFPVPGQWRIDVTTDLNGDGDTSDPLEGDWQLLRIRIMHDGKEIFTTLRDAPSGLLEAGEANPLFGPAPAGDPSPPGDDVERAGNTTMQAAGFLSLRTGIWADARGPSDPGEPGAVE